MKNKEKYREFMDTFQIQRDFFKCHEILEEIWIEETKCETRKHVSINLLLIAVGLYHWRNKNYKGAIQVLENSLNNYDEVSKDIEILNIDSKYLKQKILVTIESLKIKKEYEEIYLPIY
ncbi:MAG: DUF309 domain-containing protein [Cetobacterium sp.]|uniref:DUF309 domain-containing protein n=1 Tax=Cetobacterium sp. TaxID=2071632 RepID=UPI0025C2337C|nr:DUF309 domain-containing protein [Cetobacterium sp.]